MNYLIENKVYFVLFNGRGGFPRGPGDLDTLQGEAVAEKV
jgi:hypothetical protein